MWSVLLITDLITETATKRLVGRCIYSVYTRLDKGMIYVPGRTEWDGMRFHHAAQNGAQFKT